MTFSEHLRQMRGDLTQSAFCRKLGIPMTTYQRYEKGERVPDIEVLAQIVRCTGVSADTLLGLAPAADTPGTKGNPSGHAATDKKDLVIAQQAETIEKLSQAIKALS